MSSPFSSPQHENPFASPLADQGLVRPESMAGDEEAIRRKYLSHEASIRSVGLLYYLLSFAFIARVIWTIVVASHRGVYIRQEFADLMIAAFMAPALVVLGRGLRRMLPWVRPAGLVWAALITLLALIEWNVVVVLIEGYVLWLLGSTKGKYVFSAEYQDIRRATPHIKQRRPTIIGALIVILIVFAVLAVTSYITWIASRPFAP